MQNSAINLATADGRALRRSALRGAIVVFITAGYSGKRFIFERCKQLGVRSVIVDGADSWSKGLVDDGLAERFVALDFADTDTLFDRVLEACKMVRARCAGLGWPRGWLRMMHARCTALCSSDAHSAACVRVWQASQAQQPSQSATLMSQEPFCALDA